MQNDRTKIRDKRLYLDFDNEVVREFFSHLMASFGCRLVESADDALLLLGRFGMNEKGMPNKISFSRLTDDYHETVLATPFDIETFYAEFQQLCYSPFRQHIRIKLDEKSMAELPYGEFSGKLISLSRRGARIVMERELVKGEELHIRFTLAGVDCRCRAKCIYSIGWEEENDTAGIESGLIFSDIPADVTEAIRTFIQTVTLEKIKNQMDSDDFFTALSLLQLSHKTRLALLD